MKLDLIKNYHMGLAVLTWITITWPQLFLQHKILRVIKVAILCLSLGSLMDFVLAGYVDSERKIGWLSVIIVSFLGNIVVGKKGNKQFQTHFFTSILACIIVLFCFWQHAQVWNCFKGFLTFQNSSTLVKDKAWINFLIVIVGYYVAIFSSGLIIGNICNKVYKSAEFEKSGFADAGKWIGRLERAIILTLLLAGSMDLIAWVLGLKGLLRFGEIQASKVSGGQDKNPSATLRKEVEYILIGTLLSFAAAMAVGLVLKNYFGVKFEL